MHKSQYFTLVEKASEVAQVEQLVLMRIPNWEVDLKEGIVRKILKRRKVGILRHREMHMSSTVNGHCPLCLPQLLSQFLTIAIGRLIKHTCKLSE